jgi:hypothetical protein
VPNIRSSLFVISVQYHILHTQLMFDEIHNYLSRKTLFRNDPFSLVGKDVGQPTCVESGEMNSNPSVNVASQFHKALLQNMQFIP